MSVSTRETTSNGGGFSAFAPASAGPFWFLFCVLAALPLFWCNTTYAASSRVKAWKPAVISAYHYNFNTMELAK